MKNQTYIDCDFYTDPECFSAVRAEPWETDFAALVPRFTGSISAISSSLIIYIILRSKTGLSSIYHRIMFGMSLADICGSIAMALTSLPMPSYMPKEEVFGYHWAGTRLGNTATCNAQGFFAFFGMGCMFNYNAMLCVYYACAIAFTMREKNIKKYVEPFLHAIPLIVGLAFSVPPLFNEMYNPGISAYAWCGPVAYPDECVVYEGVECIRGSAKMRTVTQIVIAVAIMYVFAVIFFSLSLVIWKVIQTDRMILQVSKLYCNRGQSSMLKVLDKHRNTKAVLIQAVSYIIAFLLGVIPPLLLSVGAVDTSGQNVDAIEFTDNFEKLTLVFLPLQGFFNFIIFISHKIYNYRRVHPDVSICKALAILFCTSAHDPLFISRISIVMKNEDSNNFVDDIDENPPKQVCNLDVKDESNEELQFRLGMMASGTCLECIPASQETDVIPNSKTNPESVQDLSNVTSMSEHSPQEPGNSSATDSKVDIQSCANSSNWLSLASKSSLGTSSLWKMNLSVDDEESLKREPTKSYYRS